MLVNYINIRINLYNIKYYWLDKFIFLLVRVSVIIVVVFIIYDKGFYMKLRNFKNLFFCVNGIVRYSVWIFYV